MYGLPADFDGTFLIGRTLEQICFSENQISLHFDADVGVTIESAYAYQEDVAAAEKTPTHSVPASQSNLMQLLGQTIGRVEGASDGTLSLLFTNGHRLWCFDNPQYQSYQIRDGARVIIVWGDNGRSSASRSSRRLRCPRPGWGMTRSVKGAAVQS